MSDFVSTPAKEIDAGTKSLSILDKLGLIPMWGWRKHNMINAKEVELELDKMQQAHNRSQEIEAAKVKITTMIAMEQANCRIEETKKMIGNPNVTDDDIKKHFELTARAAASVCNEAIASQYTKERIGLYALKEISENPGEKITEENPSETWMTRFLKSAADMRDEDVMRLWGKILAGEIKKPGSFSLRTLDILHCLDQRDSEIFVRLAPYVINERYIPKKALKEIGLGEFAIANLENSGLFITSLLKSYEDNIHANNRNFVLMEEPGNNARAHPYLLEAVFLTTSASELYRIIQLSEEQSWQGIQLLKQAICEKDSISFKITKL